MGAQRPKHGALRLYRPWVDILTRALLLILTFAMMMIGFQEAWMSDDHGWAWFFAAGALAIIVLYTGCVWDFITWLDYEYPIPEESTDLVYRSAENEVDFLYDGRHRRVHPDH